MGSFYRSMHFKTDDAEAVHAAARAVIAQRGHMYISQAAKGWVSAYPDEQAGNPGVAQKIAAKAKVAHAIAFSVQDSDVLTYWYFRDGKPADFFNSCPDYFGKALKKDLAAVGNPKAFDGLLPKAGQAALAKLIARRMINGEFIGRGPEFDFEDDRLRKIAELLKIPGVPGSYDDLANDGSIPGVGSVKDMTPVGKASRRSAASAKPPKVVRDGNTVKVGAITFHISTTPLRLDSPGKTVAAPERTRAAGGPVTITSGAIPSTGSRSRPKRTKPKK